MHSMWIGCLLLWSATLLLHSHATSVYSVKPTNSSVLSEQPCHVLNYSTQYVAFDTIGKDTVQTYYVKPSNEKSCPSEPCHVLSYYAQNNTFNKSNAKFVFLPGNHTLNTTIVVENVENLILTGDDQFETGLLGLPAPSCQIHCHCYKTCTNGTGFLFLEMSNLAIQNLLLSNCSHTFRLKRWYNSTLTLRNVFNASIDKVTVQHSPGGGILAINVIGHITDSSIIFSVGTFLLVEYHHGYHCQKSMGNTFIVKSSSFLHGYGLAAVINNACPNIELSFEDITVNGSFGVTMYIDYGWNTSESSSVIISNSTFSHGNTETILTMSTVFLYHAKNVIFSNCTIEHNIGTALTADSSVLTFKGNMTFRNNTGMDGGALHLSDSSFVKLDNNTNVFFISNRAKYFGGAIYASGSDSIIPNRLCFFQVPDSSESDEIHLHFENNTAKSGGSIVYGGSIDTSIMTNGLRCSNCFDKLFNLTNTHSDPSVVSSDPIGVCLCTGKIPSECNSKKNRKRKIQVYPGQIFNISAITVGQRGGTVTGVIRADVGNAQIEPIQELQAIDSYDHCKNLTYTLFTSSRSVTLTLTAAKATSSPIITKRTAKVHVTILKCPPGFNLTNPAHSMCDCAHVLKKHRISCDINKGTVHRPKSTWIGYYNASDDNKKDGVLYYPHCPLDYCKHTDMDIQLTNPDEQCAFNHSGILCGSCKPGLSLALGTPQCLKCSNTYLILLIPFGLAGLALVFLLVVCNLTVTEGTLNGLIFYANLMWVNKAIFFPSNHTNIFTVFIAWVNLDLGLQTCFYDGMDAYQNTWMQFAFPMYIWTIVGLIIYLSKYRIVNKIIGPNVVKVLATLFLLSAKLQHTIIVALSFTYILYPGNSKKFVWLYDGSVEYLTGKHIPLFMGGLVFLLFMILPYILALLLIRHIRKIATPRYRLLRWIVRLLPLFDAYTAPYKPRYQFWTGFLLLVRSILFVVFAVNYSNDPALNLVAIVITSLLVFTLVWGLGGIYKKQMLNILESSFFLNLGAVSVIVLYTGPGTSKSSIVVYVSTGIAFATFVGIMLYHCYKQLTKTGLWRMLRATARSQLGVGRENGGDETEPLSPVTDLPQPTVGEIPHIVSYNTRGYRESMLEIVADSRD